MIGVKLRNNVRLFHSPPCRPPLKKITVLNSIILLGNMIHGYQVSQFEDLSAIIPFGSALTALSTKVSAALKFLQHSYFSFTEPFPYSVVPFRCERWDSKAWQHMLYRLQRAVTNKSLKLNWWTHDVILLLNIYVASCLSVS